MRTFILLIFIGLFSYAAKAQIGNSYSAFGIGMDVSQTLGFTDLVHQNPGYSINGHINYNFSPYVPVSLELQHGQISGGGDTYALDKSLRKYRNNFTAALIRIDLQLGEIVPFDNPVIDLFKNFYAGFGFGGIYNQVLTNRIKPDGSHYYFPGKNSSLEFLASGRIGYVIKIYNSFNEPTYGINICYIHNFDIGDNLDGYNDPTSKFKNKDTDHYRQFSIGITYNFGTIVPYYHFKYR